MPQRRIIGGSEKGSQEGPEDQLTRLPKSTPMLFIISGPSGVGKDALVDQMKQREPGRYYAITTTTRQPRLGEEDGVHYRFRTRAQFQDMIANDELLEWAEVYENYYGVPRSEIENGIALNLDVVLKVDVQGAATISARVPQAIRVFLVPFSNNELLQRHNHRQTGAGHDLSIRLDTAQREMAEMAQFDYVVVNKQGELLRAVQQIEAIMWAEKSRVVPRLLSESV